jgi:ABC-2 type transport system ATP-binding protein
MKCELAAALVHRPKRALPRRAHDRPRRLDAGHGARVRQRYNERYEATLLLTSHYMEDVQRLCPRVIVIDKGKLVYDGALDELVTQIRPDKRVILRFSRPVDDATSRAYGQRRAHDAGESVLDVHKDAGQPRGHAGARRSCP